VLTQFEAFVAENCQEHCRELVQGLPLERLLIEPRLVWKARATAVAVFFLHDFTWNPEKALLVFCDDLGWLQI
jgi:hypothetical protein